VPPFSFASGLREEEETVRYLAGPLARPCRLAPGSREEEREPVTVTDAPGRRRGTPAFRSAPCAVDRVASDPADFAAMQAKVGQIAIAQVGKLAHRATVGHPSRDVLRRSTGGHAKRIQRCARFPELRIGRRCHVLSLAKLFVFRVTGRLPAARSPQR